MTQDGSVAWVIDQGPEIGALLARCRRRHVLWEEFEALPRPEGMTAETAWHLVSSIRRHLSVEIPIRSPEGHRLWYFPHQQIVSHLHEIERHCRADSELSNELAAREGSPFVVRTQIEEAIATSQLDGLDIPSDYARTLLQLERTPRDGRERLVLNTFRAIGEIHRFAGDPFSPALLQELYRMVVDGVDSAAVKRRPERFGLCRSSYRSMVGPQTYRLIEEICAYANDELGDPAEHAAIRALNLRGALKQWQPLPDWNGNITSLVWRLYCLKKGYPLLGHLPLCRAILVWERGGIRPPEVLAMRLPEQYVDPEGREDYTPNVTIALQLVHHELQGLRDQISLRKARDLEVLRSLQEDSTLNHRQRSVIGRAFRNPEAEFSIRYHRTNHRVVYATARHDLVELVEKGYLLCEQRGRAFIFRPHPRIGDRLRPSPEAPVA